MEVHHIAHFERGQERLEKNIRDHTRSGKGESEREKHWSIRVYLRGKLQIGHNCTIARTSGFHAQHGQSRAKVSVFAFQQG